MVKSVFAFLAVILLTMIPFLYNNCGSQVQFSSPTKAYGTVTGNPLTPTNASSEILFAICSVLDRCQAQVPFNTCMTGVAATDGIGVTLGLPAGAYDPYSSIETAEANGKLAANLTNTNTCIDTINNLSCTNPNVLNAYNPANPNPFAGVPGMVPTQSCGQVFSTTYEYLYLQDPNIQSIPGYSINLTTGVLTALTNLPAIHFGTILTLDKLASDEQILMATSLLGGAGYWITPTTGALTALSGSGSAFLAGGGQPQFYSIANSMNNGWVTSVDPNTGTFTNSTETGALPAPVTHPTYTELSPDGNYVYFVDPQNKAIAGYSISGSALNPVSGVGIGTGVNSGDKTYGLTLLPAPNAGSYNYFAPGPYLDVAAGVIYLLYYGSTATDNNWIMPYKINADGSLSTGTPLNLGTDPANGSKGAMVGDSNGKYLFVSLPKGSLGNNGINTYSIGVNGTLTQASGPVFVGTRFYALVINSENSILFGNGTTLVSTSINLGTGALTPISNVADPCGNRGPMVLDPSESFVYAIDYPTSPPTLCGFKTTAAGVLGPITGQTYPLPIPGTIQTISAVAVQIKSP